MADRPIIFSGPMVRALLDGRKSMTRRLAWKDTPVDTDYGPGVTVRPTPWQRVQPGDRLWVREACAFMLGTSAIHGGKAGIVQYRADMPADTPPFTGKWKPSIHMPRWASRLTLVVTATKIERLQDISEADARAEGYPADEDCTPGGWFMYLWAGLHGVENWNASPEVVALTFTVHHQNIDRESNPA